MAKLKLGALLDDNPIKVTIELPAALHRDLVAYAEVLASKPASLSPTHKADRPHAGPLHRE